MTSYCLHINKEVDLEVMIYNINVGKVGYSTPITVCADDSLIGKHQLKIIGDQGSSDGYPVYNGEVYANTKHGFVMVENIEEEINELNENKYEKE